VFLITLLQALGLVRADLERHVAPGGSDSADASAAAPYRTVARALADAAQRADRQPLFVFVRGAAGQPFVESLAVPSHVTIEGPSDAAARPQLQAAGPGPAIRVAGGASARAAAVRLRNLELRAAGDDHAVALEHADDVVLSDCTLTGAGGGLSVASCSGVKLQGCRLRAAA
jgi:hypothetical protein